MKREASAVWRGELKTGNGAISSPSGVLDGTPYSFSTRFEDGITGTNPEELIAAAHAACFAMAFNNELTKAGHTPESVASTASLHLALVDGKFEISKVHLDAEAKVPVISQDEFDRIALAAKVNCPVSKVLNAEITLTAILKN